MTSKRSPLAQARLQASVLCKPGQHRTGLTMLELIVSMGLLSMIMLPILGLLSTTYKVYQSNETSSSSAYTRTSALDGCRVVLRDAVDVTRVRNQRLDVQFANGQQGALLLAGGNLELRVGSRRQIVAADVSSLQFRDLTTGAAGNTAGHLIQVAIGGRRTPRSSTDSSLTQVWVRPPI